MHIKNINVKNHKNILVQIPGFVSNNWGLKNGDKVSVEICDKTHNLIIKPKRKVV